MRLVMDRRQVMKEMAALGVAPMIPQSSLFSQPSGERNIHIVGLGSGGCAALKHIHRRGMQARFTCITDPRERHRFASDIHYVAFHSPGDYVFPHDWRKEGIVLPEAIQI